MYVWQRVNRGVIMGLNDDLKINFDKVGKACRQVGEEWEKMMRENNPFNFNTVEKIVKDIADRQDKEMAMEFTKCIGELLRKNGVVPVIDEYIHESTEENYIECKYGVAITGLDFTKHDKKFKDEIERLKRQIKKLESIRTRCHESARDSFDLGNYGCLHIVTADELKTTKDVNDRMVELPFDPLETANMLINATYKAEIPFLEKQFDRNVYNIDDLEQIAEHLLVYCKHNREDE